MFQIELQFFDKNGNETKQIDTGSIEDYYLISVSIDNINKISAKTEKISFLKTQCDAISLSIDDLSVYNHYFESPLTFLHFLKQRRAATSNRMITLNDELDHLGLYIEYNCYAMCFEDATEFSMLSLVGYREKLDTYFCELYHPGLQPQKPEQQIPDLYRTIIAFLEKSNLPYKVRASNYLLDFSQDARETLCVNIENALKRQKHTGRALILSSAGRFSHDFRYTCFINQPGVEMASQNEQADCVMSTMLWNDERSRVLLCIGFNEQNNICHVSYKLFRKEDVPAYRRDELFEQGKKRAEYRLESYRKQHGNKIGRNEDCPCGSGKKYKRCCGR